MLIHPKVTVTPDCPTVKFREPREKVDLSVEMPKILNANGWGLGTYIHVQFVSHDETRLFASGLFIVTEEAEAIHTRNPDAYQPMTSMVVSRKAVQIGDWFVAGSEAREKASVRWNPGKKVHEVLVGDEVLFASADKDEAEKFRAAA